MLPRGPQQWRFARRGLPGGQRGAAAAHSLFLCALRLPRGVRRGPSSEPLRPWVHAFQDGLRTRGLLRRGFCATRPRHAARIQRGPCPGPWGSPVLEDLRDKDWDGVATIGLAAHKEQAGARAALRCLTTPERARPHPPAPEVDPIRPSPPDALHEPRARHQPGLIPGPSGRPTERLEGSRWGGGPRRPGRKRRALVGCSKRAAP
mmetsp:Transcript_61717/g.171068  ORF Transcript_61717/g.171068 Transcript_61717/m.171068 type:complete len:205 (+) Transcript_61717:340-954(+)